MRLDVDFLSGIEDNKTKREEMKIALSNALPEMNSLYDKFQPRNGNKDCIVTLLEEPEKE